MPVQIRRRMGLLRIKQNIALSLHKQLILLGRQYLSCCRKQHLVHNIYDRNQTVHTSVVSHLIPSSMTRMLRNQLIFFVF